MDTPTEEIAQVKWYLLLRNPAFRMGDIYSQVAMDCLSGKLWDETETDWDIDTLGTASELLQEVCRLINGCQLAGYTPSDYLKTLGVREKVN